MQCSKEIAISLMNVVAEAMQVIIGETDEPKSLASRQSMFEIETHVDNTLSNALSHGAPSLLSAVTETLNRFHRTNIGNLPLAAYSVVLWFQNHISYVFDEDDPHTLSLFSLLPDTSVVSATEFYLNSNGSTTNILLFPLFDTLKGYARDDPSRYHRLFNRDSIPGIHSDYLRFGYKLFDDNKAITQTFLHYLPSSKLHPDHFRIGFVPITNKRDLVQTKTTTVTEQGHDHNVIEITGIRDTQLCEDILRNSLVFASNESLELDLLFSPELLGTENMYNEDEDGVLPYIENIANSCENSLPNIIVLPSHATNRLNFTVITNNQGVALGKQHKHNAYIDASHHAKEALRPRDKIEVHIIHIPGNQRIVVLICYDFLSKASSELFKFVFEQIDPSLVIVPSYSPGEEDFMNQIMAVAPYGTSVVWGNCCAATRSGNRIIGACKAAGIDAPARMSDCCICGNECDNKTVCMFYIDLPRIVRFGESSTTHLSFNHIYH